MHLFEDFKIGACSGREAMRPDFQVEMRWNEGPETSLPRRLFAIEPKSKLRRGNVVQRCSKHSRLLLAERALKTALSLFPKRHRLGELSPSGLRQRNQAIALVVFIRDHFDQPLSLQRLDAVSQC